MARALGAEEPEGELIAGVLCKPRPLAMKELGELERLCLASYRRSFIQTFSENLDLLPESTGRMLIQQKMEEAARLDLNTLPVRFAYPSDKVKMTPELAAWLNENLDGYSEPAENETEAQTETRLKQLVGVALEGGLISEAEYGELTNGAKLRKSKVPYVSWWISSTFDGRMAMAWMAFSKCGITRAAFEDAVSADPGMLVRMAQRIQTLTVPAVGNG